MNTVTYLITFDTANPDNPTARALNAYNAFHTQLTDNFPYMVLNNDIVCLGENHHLNSARLAFTFIAPLPRINHWDLTKFIVYMQASFPINIYLIKLSYFDYSRDEFGELRYDPFKRAENDLHGVSINEYVHRQVQPIAMTPRNLSDRMDRLAETLPSASTTYHFDPQHLLEDLLQQDQDEVPL